MDRTAQETERRLRRRIESRRALIGVVGLGYVGLPVAVSFAEAGFRVVGVDATRSRVRTIAAGRSYLKDVPADRIAGLREAGSLRASGSYRSLSRADVVIVCLPTPLRDGAPDLSAIEEGARSLAPVLKDGVLVVLESTSYPGTTEEVLGPLLEAGGRRLGRDLLLAFSPERIDPGNVLFGFGDIPKVVGGATPESTAVATRLYETVVPKVVPVSGTREAEFAKLLENTYRHVNIALVNELSIYARELGIDIWESIEAAATKPFGFMPFWPGPGWGGHCIPLDPAYLSWRVRKERAHDVRFVQLAHEINAEMPRHVVEGAALALNERSRAVRGARILVVGAAYKAGTEDTRESPALKVMAELVRRGAEVRYHDPLVPEARAGGVRLASVPLDLEALDEQDLVLVLIPQEGVDWSLLERTSAAVLDCCNAMGGRVSRL